MTLKRMSIHPDGRQLAFSFRPGPQEAVELGQRENFRLGKK
jgi:hypothetical protein